MAITKQDKPSGTIDKEDNCSEIISIESKPSVTLDKEDRPKSPRIGEFGIGRFGAARFNRTTGYEKIDKVDKPTITLTKEDKPS